MKYLRLLTACLLSIAVFSPAYAAPVDDASAYVNDLGNQALVTIQNANLDKDKKKAALETIFATNVDINWVGRFVMGRFWREATEDQKRDYLATYQNFLTSGYAARFADYTGGSFKITNAKADQADEYTVSMEIAADDKSQPPIVIDYKVRGKKPAFKVFDIIVEGVSLITTQRSEFASVLNQKGIDGLIQQLKSHQVASSVNGSK